MKAKIIMIIDVILISITTFYVLNFEKIESSDPSTTWALEGFSDLRKFLLALIYLGIEVLVLIIVGIIMIYKKHRNR